MQISRKWLIIFSVLGMMLLGIGGLFGFAYLRLTNIKDPLIQTLHKYIDGRLEMERAELSIFPPGLELQGVTLWAPDASEPSAKIKRAHLQFNLLPLIQKKIESSLVIQDPVIYLRTRKSGSSNMEAIFAPLINQAKPENSALEALWWRRIAVERLHIQNAHFISTLADGKPGTELKNIQIKADHIRFETQREPAQLKIRYEMPQYSTKPIALDTQLRFYPEQQVMALENGRVTWGPLGADLTGKIALAGPVPSKKQSKKQSKARRKNKRKKSRQKKSDDLQLDLKLQGKGLALAKLDKILKTKPRLRGVVDVIGAVTGSPFAPLFSLQLDALQVKAKGHSLSKLHALVVKEKKAIHLKKTSFGIFGGTVGLTGRLTPGGDIPAQLKVKLSGLSLAAASGKKGSPARLSGNLSLKSPAATNAAAYSGGGSITVGPIPLPQIDFKKKIRIAEVLAAGTGVNSMINVGMLGNSANVIGTQIPKVRAKVSLGGGNLTLHSFNLGNGHFNATGSGKLIQQKNLQASGVFTLNSKVTSQFIRDPILRRVLTDGKNRLSFPFSLAGPIADPKLSVNSSGLKGKMAMATALMLQQQLMGGQLNPQGMLNEALKGTPMGDPKNPLGQFLGAAVKAPSQQQTSQPARRQTNTRKPKRQPKQTKTKRPSTGNSLADQLLFGN